MMNGNLLAESLEEIDRNINLQESMIDLRGQVEMWVKRYFNKSLVDFLKDAQSRWEEGDWDATSMMAKIKLKDEPEDVGVDALNLCKRACAELMKCESAFRNEMLGLTLRCLIEVAKCIGALEKYDRILKLKPIMDKRRKRGRENSLHGKKQEAVLKQKAQFIAALRQLEPSARSTLANAVKSLLPDAKRILAELASSEYFEEDLFYRKIISWRRTDDHFRKSLEDVLHRRLSRASR